MNSLLGLQALNLDPPDLYLLSSWDYRCEPLVPGFPGFFVFIPMSFMQSFLITPLLLTYSQRGIAISHTWLLLE
jgi:hypothetical protein